MHRYPPIIIIIATLLLSRPLVETRPPDRPQLQQRYRLCSKSRFTDSQREIEALSLKAGKLADAGKTTPMSTLARQLSRNSCTLSLPAPSEKPIGSAKIYTQRKPGTLLVGHLWKCDDCANWHFGPATGFVLAKGIAVTNYHVVDQQDKSTMVVASSKGDVYPVTEVLAANRKDDVAVLRFTGGDDLPPIPLAREVRIGTTIHVLSHPQGRLYLLTKGIVAGYYKENATRMLVTADYAQGSSGGPVLDGRGNIAGIVSATNSIYAEAEGGDGRDLQMVEKLCIPVSRIRALIKAPEKTR